MHPFVIRDSHPLLVFASHSFSKGCGHKGPLAGFAVPGIGLGDAKGKGAKTGGGGAAILISSLMRIQQVDVRKAALDACVRVHKSKEMRSK